MVKMHAYHSAGYHPLCEHLLSCMQKAWQKHSCPFNRLILSALVHPCLNKGQQDHALSTLDKCMYVDMDVSRGAINMWVYAMY